MSPSRREWSPSNSGMDESGNSAIRKNVDTCGHGVGILLRNRNLPRCRDWLATITSQLVGGMSRLQHGKRSLPAFLLLQRRDVSRVQVRIQIPAALSMISEPASRRCWPLRDSLSRISVRTVSRTASLISWYVLDSLEFRPPTVGARQHLPPRQSQSTSSVGARRCRIVSRALSEKRSSHAWAICLARGNRIPTRAASHLYVGIRASTAKAQHPLPLPPTHRLMPGLASADLLPGSCGRFETTRGSRRSKPVSIRAQDECRLRDTSIVLFGPQPKGRRCAAN